MTQTKMIRTDSEAIRSLRADAGQAGDQEQVKICDRALNGSSRAIKACERAMRDAAAQWAAKIVRVDGGYMAFESIDDYRMWANQK